MPALVNGQEALGLTEAEFEPLRPDLARVMRMAKLAFPTAAIDVTLSREGKPWRAVAEDGALQPSDIEALTRNDNRHAVRVPIQFSDGRIVGALTVLDETAASMEWGRLGAVSDLANAVGHELECYQSRYRLKEQLEAVTASEQRFRTVIEDAGLHVWELDFLTGERVTTGKNDQFYAGPRSYQEMLTDPWFAVHPDDKAAAMATWT